MLNDKELLHMFIKAVQKPQGEKCRKRASSSLAQLIAHKIRSQSDNNVQQQLKDSIQ
ncbi:MAG: hypothetical protein H6R07_3081 [Proteobacteria bacterium]|nr:hypothetical protein [Pseudomonadota bacterium]